MSDIQCWHGTTETLAQVHRRQDSEALVDVVLPVGVWTRWAAEPVVTMTVTLPGSPAQASYRSDAPDSPLRPVTRHTVQAMRQARTESHGEPGRAEAMRHYRDLELALQDRPQNGYYELRLERVPPGRLECTVEASLGSIVSDDLHFALQVAAAQFTADDTWHVESPPNLPDKDWYQHWWVLMVQEDGAAGYDHVRLDLLDTIRTAEPDVLPNVTLDLGEGRICRVAPATDPEVAGQAVGTIDWLPIIDRNRDSIILSVPRIQGRPLTTVQVTTTTPSIHLRASAPLRKPGSADEKKASEPSYLVIFNYCIQGLNDLFSRPLAGYRPPRTYMQVTAHDEKARYSSRPATREDGEPDGYGLTLDAHRSYGVKSHWVFNAGILLMLANDCGEAGGLLEQIAAEVAAKRISPSNAGYGAHRPSYYRCQTNVQEIENGWEVIRRLLRPEAVDGVYYPDQRLYKGLSAEIQAYQQAEVRYLVLDRSTACTDDPPPEGRQRQLYVGDSAAQGNHLLRDQDSGLRVLLIEDEVRDGMVGADADEAARGKMTQNLRRLFMERMGRDQQDRRNVLVYGDDADKASGNGWFDGDYDKQGGKPQKHHFNRKYLAALSWLSSHPWVSVVTTADLEALETPATDVRISSASCPSVDPGGASTCERYGAHHALHFDSWYDRWCVTRSVWLDTTLETLTGELQDELCTPGTVDDLRRLAWLYFLMNTHESFWNQEPLEGHDVNAVDDVRDPEDFVVAESLQLRNAWVYLHAQTWATWSLGHRSSDTTRVNDGDVVTSVRAGGLADAPWPNGPKTGLYWDRDLLENIVVYNGSVLLVLDRNGGRVTQVFVRIGDRAVSVSGTPKAYQFFVPQPGGDDAGAVVCDGEALQNTVFTPNHRYVAADVLQSMSREGRHVDPRLGSDPIRWLYPDNFNEYDAEIIDAGVRFRYAPQTQEAPSAGDLTDAAFLALCERDRIARTAAGPGPGVVWHLEGQGFSKTVTLDGRTIHVAYQNASRGHLVSNEFCIDLLAAALGADHQLRSFVSRSRVILTGPGALTVEVSCGQGCEFVPAARSASLPQDDAAAADYLELRRVLTDDLRIVCLADGDFDYSIVLPPE